MKKIFLFLCVSFCITICCLTYFKPSKAQNKELNEIFKSAQSPLFSRATNNLKQVPQMIENSKSVGVMFERREVFQSAAKRVRKDAQLRESVSDGVTVGLDKAAIQNFLKEDVKYITLPLPDSKGRILELELVKVDIFALGFSVKMAKPTGEKIDESPGVHYRGIVKGNNNSLAAISIFKNEVMGFISTEADGNSVVGRLGGKNLTDKHIIYADRSLKERPDVFCETKDTINLSLPESILQEP